MVTKRKSRGTKAAASPPPEAVESTDLAPFSQTDAALAELRQRYAGKEFDLDEPDEWKEADRARKTLKKLRTWVEARRKELKAPLLERGRLIDEEAKRVTGELVALEGPIVQALDAKAQEEAEAERRKAEAAERERQTLERIRYAPTAAVVNAYGVDELAAAITHWMEFDVAAVFHISTMEEAEDAIVATVASLTRLRNDKLAQEAQARELAALRAQLAAQASPAAVPVASPEPEKIVAPAETRAPEALPETVSQDGYVAIGPSGVRGRAATTKCPRCGFEFI